MKDKSIQIFGWYGTAAILLAYFLNSFGIIGPENMWYQGLNITGALGIVFESYTKKDYQPMVLNVIWTLIGLVAIVKIIQ